MKKVIVSLLVAGSVFAVSSCKKSSSTPSTTARVNFVNGCAGTSALSLNVNGTPIPSASTLTYLKASGYQSFTAGSDSFNVVISSTAESLISAMQQTTAGSNYSVFASGLSNKGSIIVTTDDLTAPASGTAKIRLINACADTNVVEGTAAEPGAASIEFGAGLNYATASPFSTISAGSYKVVTYEPSNAISVKDTDNVQFSSGKIYTVMFSGNSGGGYNLTIFANN